MFLPKKKQEVDEVEDLPIHIHQNFDAEADLEILPTDRGVGKWKIKKKSNYSLF